MLTTERHHIILSLLKKQEVVKLQELVDATGASESTIRRDLNHLEQTKFLKRVHGGASLLQGKRIEPSISEKEAYALEEKRQIAELAVSLIEDGDSIFLDAGTTTRQMIELLPSKEHLTVVTNGLSLVEPLINANIEVYTIGGFVKPRTKAMVGASASESLNTFRFDKCFMGTNGIHPEYGYTTPDPEEAAIKADAMRLSRERYMLADSSKFGEIAFAKINDLNEATILTSTLDEEHRSIYEKETQIKVVTS
ncbi:DeoR/GlpR family DNA-binding transcription regulator [Bacillus tianshenii]|nr:DeoR/GlpR family DNA-binding transcription regulator [Bacillus tianshenii]